MSETFLLQEPSHTCWISKSGLDTAPACQDSTSLSYTLMLDGFDEAFLQETWPALSWYEKRTYAKNRLLKAHEPYCVHLVRTDAHTLQGASTSFDKSAFPLPTHGFLKGISLLSWHLGTAFQTPTLLQLDMPSGYRRLYFFKDGTPLFSRTLTTHTNGQHEAMEATLYHMERTFQTPRTSVDIVHWCLVDLVAFLQKKQAVSYAFAHPLKTHCSTLAKKRIGVASALATNLLLLGVALYQGVDLFMVHQDTNTLTLQRQTLEHEQKSITTLPSGQHAPLVAFERLQKAPHPFKDLQYLSVFNTSSMGVQALSWKKEGQDSAFLEVQVCARQSSTHHDFEKLVVTQQQKLSPSLSLTLAEEATPVIHFDETQAPLQPCIVLHSASKRRP